jgi:hypothetical protein
MSTGGADMRIACRAMPRIAALVAVAWLVCAVPAAAND